MFIVKLMRYEPGAPSQTDAISIREANAVHVRYENDLRTVVQLGDAPGAPGTSEAMEVTIGDREDCSYNVAYIMNMQGKTIETIR
jgi:hypothetical protein